MKPLHLPGAALLSRACAVATLATLAAPPDLSEGQPFPPITLPLAQDGRLCSVNDFSGSKTMLHIFAAW